MQRRFAHVIFDNPVGGEASQGMHCRILHSVLVQIHQWSATHSGQILHVVGSDTNELSIAALSLDDNLKAHLPCGLEIIGRALLFTDNEPKDDCATDMPLMLFIRSSSQPWSLPTAHCARNGVRVSMKLLPVESIHSLLFHGRFSMSLIVPTLSENPVDDLLTGKGMLQITCNGMIKSIDMHSSHSTQNLKECFYDMTRNECWIEFITPLSSDTSMENRISYKGKSPFFWGPKVHGE